MICAHGMIRIFPYIKIHCEQWVWFSSAHAWTTLRNVQDEMVFLLILVDSHDSLSLVYCGVDSSRTFSPPLWWARLMLLRSFGCLLQVLAERDVWGLLGKETDGAKGRGMARELKGLGKPSTGGNILASVNASLMHSHQARTHDNPDKDSRVCC